MHSFKAHKTQTKAESLKISISMIDTDFVYYICNKVRKFPKDLFVISYLFYCKYSYCPGHHSFWVYLPHLSVGILSSFCKIIMFKKIEFIRYTYKKFLLKLVFAKIALVCLKHMHVPTTWQIGIILLPYMGQINYKPLY